MTTLRFKMVEEAIKRKALEVKSPEALASEYFGIHVFNREKWQNICLRKLFGR